MGNLEAKLQYGIRALTRMH